MSIICALCERQTSPKNGVKTTPDAVLCTDCLVLFEAAPEYKRFTRFKKPGQEGPRASALTDFIQIRLKERKVQHEREQNEKSLEAAKTPAAAPPETSLALVAAPLRN